MIREFQEYLAPSVPQLKLERGVDCAESYPTYKAASPALKKSGVYLIFDDSQAPRYIGLAMDRSLIERILYYRTEKRFTPRWIDVIPFDPEWVFFAPSLESFLIDRIIRLGEEHITLVNVRGKWPAYVYCLNRALARDEE
jgi:hypothetical protein